MWLWLVVEYWARANCFEVDGDRISFKQDTKIALMWFGTEMDIHLQPGFLQPYMFVSNSFLDSKHIPAGMLIFANLFLSTFCLCSSMHSASK